MFLCYYETGSIYFSDWGVKMPESKSFIQENYVFGLDIGTRSIVGIVGYQTTSSFVVVADYVLEHDTRAMMDGQIHDVEKVAHTIKVVKHELEKQLDFPLKKVSIAAAGRVLKTKLVHVEQEVDMNSPVNEDRVFAIELLGIEKAHQEINQSLEQKDVGFHCVGYTVSRYYLNDYEIGNLIGHKAKKIGADVLATFLPKEVVESLHQVVEAAGLIVNSLTLEPIAAINIAIPKQYRLLNIALVDIGAGTSDIAITKGGSIIAYGMIPIAGDELTEAIVHQYLVDFKTAETIKIKSSSKCKQISYKDVLGISHKVLREEIDQTIEATALGLAKSISDKIIELNGGTSTNAVFIVGGGGQITKFTELLASLLGISSDRVALRGKAVLESVTFQTSRKKSPELVTPLGICFSGFENNKHEFVQVFLNDEPVKVFDTNHLTVMDIAAFKGFNPKNLIAKRGEDLRFTFNHLEMHVRGEVGEPAQILINNKQCSLNERVVMNDYISIIPAKKGKDGRMSSNQLMEKVTPCTFHINGTKCDMKPNLSCNGEILTINYDIHNQDEILALPISIKKAFSYFDLPYFNEVIFVNGIEVNREFIIQDNDYIEYGKLKKQDHDSSDSLPAINQEEKQEIQVVVNGQVVQLTGKKTYLFVDVFAHISFDLSKPKGIIECEINHKKSSYMDVINQGDDLKVYWSQI